MEAFQTLPVWIQLVIVFLVGGMLVFMNIGSDHVTTLGLSPSFGGANAREQGHGGGSRGSPTDDLTSLT
jgi:hypothetical protein